MNFLRYTIWPWIKVKSIFWWWVLKYGGKKNIPSEVLFNQMAKSLEKMKSNLEDAFKIGSGDMDKEEFLEAARLIDKVKEFEKDIMELKK